MGQGVVYAELRQLLFYLIIIKIKKHEKSVNVRITKIKSLIYRIKAAVETNRNI